MLGWSINLFHIFGIQLAVHGSFLLLLAYAGYDGWQDGGGSVGMLWNVALIICFFVCVVLHELGHSLTARRFGVHVPRILLLPIGGMAQFDRIPKKPSEELLITIAGPAVNFALVALLLPFAWRAVFGSIEVTEYSAGTLVTQLCVANLLMGTFNLLPVFPMDGGRIFRAALATQTSHLKATYWAALLGKILAVTFALIAAFCFNRPLTCLLFLFIYWAGDAEYRMIRRQEENQRYVNEMVARAKAIKPFDRNEPPLLAG